MSKNQKNSTSTNLESRLKAIVDAIDYNRMVSLDKYPIPGNYYITGPQVGSDNLITRVGYVVQVRKEAGAFGSDLMFVRHPDGTLMTHENQFFFQANGYWKEKIIELYDKDVNPQQEDYSEACTIGGKYPEFGKIIEPKESDRPLNENPSMQITVSKVDGSKTVHVV